MCTKLCRTFAAHCDRVYQLSVCGGGHNENVINNTAFHTRRDGFKCKVARPARLNGKKVLWFLGIYLPLPLPPKSVDPGSGTTRRDKTYYTPHDRGEVKRRWRMKNRDAVRVYTGRYTAAVDAGGDRVTGRSETTFSTDRVLQRSVRLPCGRASFRRHPALNKYDAGRPRRV